MEDRGICGLQKRFSQLKTSSTDKSSKVRVYDKTSQPAQISPLATIETLQNAINNLHQHPSDGVQQQSNLIQQYRFKIAEISLKKQNEMLQEELDSTKCLLERQTHRAEESIVQNDGLSKQVEKLTKICGELQEYYVKLLQEKKEQTMEFESLHVDLQDKLSSLAASKLLLEEKSNSLQGELDGMSQKTGELQETHVKILQEKEERIMEYESSHADLQEQISSLAAAKLLLEEKTNSLQGELDRLKEKFGELQETQVKILQEKEDQKMESESLHVELQEQISSLAAAKLFLEEKTNSLQGELDKMSERFGELQETRVKILQEKEDQRMNFESLHADLQDKLSSLRAAQMRLEEETNSLQSELDRRTSVLDEEKVNLKGRLRELETALGSLNKDLQCSRAMEDEKEEQIVDLRHQLLENEKTKTCLEQKNNSLVSEMEKCKGENSLLRNRIKELESVVQCVNKDLESKLVRLLELTERQSLLENGKPKCVHEKESENGKENVLHEKPKPNGDIEGKTPAKANGDIEGKTPAKAVGDIEGKTPAKANGDIEGKTPAKAVGERSEKRNPKQVVKERTPKQLGGKTSPATVPWR